MRNIELKARLADRTRAEAVCRELGAAYQGELDQTDTYFRVVEGRLKLREQTPGDDHLIFYRRDDRAEARESDYVISPAPPELKGVLSDALGVGGVVHKVRSLWLWDNVRIHLDRVEGLGDYIEFEAVLDESHSDADGIEKNAQLMRAFDLSRADIETGSYADLLLAQSSVRDGS